MSIEPFLLGNTVSSIIPSAALDVVAIYDQDYNQLFRNARPISGTISPNAKLMEHPVEEGTEVADHIIFTPIEIELLMFLIPGFFRETYEDIFQVFMNAQVLIVQTKTKNYPNMTISAVPHDESPEIFDAVYLTLKLKQTQFYQTLSATAVVPKNPNNSATQDRGVVNPTPANDVQKAQTTSAAGQLFGRAA